MKKNIIKKLFFFIILFNLFILNNIHPEKYYLDNNWYYKINNNETWQIFDLKKSLKKQNINLKLNDVIYYKYVLKYDDIKPVLDKYNNIGFSFSKIEGITDVFFNDKICYKFHGNATMIFCEINKKYIKEENIILLKITKKLTFMACKFSYTPYIDNYNNILNNFYKIYFYHLIVALCLLVIGLYYLMFYNSRLNNYEYILYFLTCLTTGLYSLLKSNFKLYIINNFNFNWLLVEKIIFIAIYLQPILGLLFLLKISNEKSKIMQKFKYAFSIITILLILIIIFSNFNIMVLSLIFFHSSTLLIFIIFFYLVIKQILIKNKEFIFIFVGLIILIFFSYLDIAGIWYFVKATNQFPFYIVGYFFFIFTLGLYLSKQFLKINLNLYNLRLTLEEKVKKRTIQLEEEKELKTNFFINLTHETKTPLTLITNYLDKHIKENGVSNELQIVKNNIDKLKNDMVNFLDLEKQERSQIFYDHSRTINLSKMLNNKLLIFTEITKKSNIVLKKSITDNLHIKIDPDAFDRIINNLMDNAIKYNKPGGYINVVLKNKDNLILLSVTDTGIGIDEKEIDNIFKPFYQLSHKKRNIQGIGMGLSIIKNIIDEIKGTIAVKSTIDKGTEFTISFNKYQPKDNEKTDEPFEYTTPALSIPKTKIIEKKHHESRKNIFIVEDNIDMLNYLYESMSQNYNVYYAVNGKDAITKMKDIPKPDLILSDIMMDVMDGYEFYDELMKEKVYRSIPFIFLTAKSRTEEKLKGLKKGAVDYIYKPFIMEEVLAKTGSLIKMIEAEREKSIEEFSRQFYKALNEKKDVKKIKNINNKSENDIQKLAEEYAISPQEIRVINLIKEGLEYKEIAYNMNISIHTVETYRKRIFKKCGINNKVELINMF